MTDFKVNNRKERLLCYAFELLTAKLSNPSNTYNATGLMSSCIYEANMLIETIYDDAKLEEILSRNRS